MQLDLVDVLATLTRERRFDAVLTTWKSRPDNERELELPKRLAAAAFAQSGDLVSASQLLQELISRDKLDAATCALAARIFFDVGKLDASLSAWERALALTPENVGWWKWFAEAAIKALQPERALRFAETFTLHREENVDVALANVMLLAKAQRSQEALLAFERVMVRWPNHGVAGPSFAEFVMREFPLQAGKMLSNRAWLPAPAVLSAERVRASLALPAFFESEASAAEWRAHMLKQIRELTDLALASPLQSTQRAACLASTPFFAAFHDADVTPIQFAWGDFVEALVAPLRELLPTGARARGPIRKVGFVSNRFTDSSAGRFFNGWVEALVRSGFEVRLYAVGASDHETDRLSQIAIMHRVADDDVTHWFTLAQQLLADANDALVYPEPQGSPLTLLIAGLRCAPIQCAAFGNPITTGLHTMDYFLSPDASEAEAPESAYREKVVRLSGLGFAVPRTNAVSPFNRESFGFLSHERIYLVNQQLQKWSPSFVDAVCAILREDKRGRLVYFGARSSVSLRAAQMYFRDAFDAHGVDIAERTTLITGLDRKDYLAINRASDVSLDTFGYGGGSTTIDALAVGLPVVTLEGEFLRSRQTAGILRAFGSSNSVVNSKPAFIEAALLAAEQATRHVKSDLVPGAQVQDNFHSGVRAQVFDDLGHFLASVGEG